MGWLILYALTVVFWVPYMIQIFSKILVGNLSRSYLDKSWKKGSTVFVTLYGLFFAVIWPVVVLVILIRRLFSDNKLFNRYHEWVRSIVLED